MAEQKLPDKAQENEMKREKVRVVPIKYIDDSPDHPFQVRDDEEMMSLVESIATFGVITPIIARKTADERYELISGHRRKRACELLHIDTLPIIVRDLSREEGIILMVDSNLQREHILWHFDDESTPLRISKRKPCEKCSIRTLTICGMRYYRKPDKRKTRCQSDTGFT